MLIPVPTPVPSPDCESEPGTTIYRLQMFDSSGDGLQAATYVLYNSSSLTDSNEGVVVATGTLGDGSKGSDWLCLADGC